MRHRSAARALTALTAATVLGLAGCSSSASDDSAASSDSAPAAGLDNRVTSEDGPEPATALEFSSGARTSAGQVTDQSADGSAGKPARPGVQTRAVISVGKVALRSDDLVDARDQIDRLLGRYGGYVTDERTVNDDDGDIQRSTLELRVPSARFADLMAAFEDFSTVTDTSSKSDDVTTEVIDVDSRIRTQEVSLSRLRRFLGRASDVNSVIRLESEIAEREAGLSSLRAQQKYLADQTSLATITVTMTRPEPGAAQEGPEHDPGFVTGLRSGWDAFTGAVVVLLTVLGALLPFGIAVAVVGVPVLLWVRSSRRRRTAVSVPPAPTAPAG